MNKLIRPCDLIKPIHRWWKLPRICYDDDELPIYVLWAELGLHWTDRQGSSYYVNWSAGLIDDEEEVVWQWRIYLQHIRRGCNKSILMIASHECCHSRLWYLLLFQGHYQFEQIALKWSQGDNFSRIRIRCCPVTNATFISSRENDKVGAAAEEETDSY